MKICLLGEYSSRQWCGSATNKVQHNILKELSKTNSVVLYELPNTKSKLEKLFRYLSITRTNEGIIISGGIISLALHIILKQYDIIHLVVIRRYMLLLLPVLILNSTKVIITIHDTIGFRENKINQDYFIKRILLCCCRMAFVYSDSDFDLISRYKTPGEIKKINNGVDLSFYRSKKEFHPSRIITFAGGLGNSYKGLHFLESSLPGINENIELQICGENKYNLHHTKYLGELDRNEFLDQLRASYIVVIPSRYESFSMTALEAMAAGIPIIITTGCGISSRLIHQYDALIIKYGDSQALVNSIMLLLNDPELYSFIQTNALRTVKRFSWSKAAQGYTRFYKTI